jgi:hypothetical protein
MQYTITKVARYTTKQDGSPLVYTDKTGATKPYTSVRIQVAEIPDRWISGFGTAENQLWIEGAKVELEITKKMYPDGTKEYLNFSSPNWKQLTEKRLKDLEDDVAFIKKTRGITDTPVAPVSFPTSEYPNVKREEEINVDDIPF